MQKRARIQIERVTATIARQPLHPKTPERPESAQVFAGSIKASEKARQGRLARQPFDLHRFRKERITPQMRDAGELVRPGQNARDETKGNLGHR